MTSLQQYSDPTSARSRDNDVIIDDRYSAKVSQKMRFPAADDVTGDDVTGDDVTSALKRKCEMSKLALEDQIQKVDVS